MYQKMKYLLVILLAGVLACAAGVALLSNGVIQLNGFAAKDYPVRGVDVSSYQGDIDWARLSGQGIQFAFIKATEGSGYEDPYFSFNYGEASKAGLRVGAYHFFSYDSGGTTQAENFISVVPRLENALPPVVDVEFYGDKEANPPDSDGVREQLSVLLDELEAHYGVRPILYATEKSYRLYIAGQFTDCDIWIRNVISRPSLADGRQWTFWQYSNRERLEGYEGTERFIDMNVFAGTQEEFDMYPSKQPLASS